MDKETRNAIASATKDAREALEQDFREQLEGTFDVLPSGVIAPQPGAHLSAQDRVRREKIVAAIEHKRAAVMKPAAAVADYVRDAAFTTLNRFAALKMLEARGLVLECITGGEQSAGYKEFYGLASGVATLPNGAGYRLYVESLFDELSTEVKVLFDRRDAASVLWPRRPAFEQLLTILNCAELAGVWGEDETIGWVYQFFNSQEERKALRDASQAPQNSRELAVRNQFFTPRYVVQFLTDNTLGRIWHDARAGNTRLADMCTYLAVSHDDIQARRVVDPRGIRILDPACGSGHFLLYAFDLLLVIYEEAWADTSLPPSEETGRTLSDDYSSLDELRSALPGLILQYNLFGVDIDPRCAQIAQLALWMRAQRAYRAYEIPSADRPLIRRANIVTAEPFPGEADLKSSFLMRLEDDALASHLERIVEQVSLAGELGLLYRTGGPIGSSVSGDELPDFFTPSAERIAAVLHEFAQEAESVQHTRRKLFVDNASRGLGLIELAEKRYDVILMNPPFGKPTPKAEVFLKECQSDGWKDIYAGFLELSLQLLQQDGRVGAITSSQYFHTRQLRTLREALVARRHPRLLVDLGPDVLDGAAVQTAMIVLGSQRTSGAVSYADLFSSETKEEALVQLLETDGLRLLALEDLEAIPGEPFCLHATPAILGQWLRDSTLDPHTARVATGNHTFDDERFLRLRHEVSSTTSGESWVTFEKGGEFQPFYAATLLVLDWRNDGAALRALNTDRYGSDAQVMQSSRFWFRKGLCYTHVSSVGFSPRVLPEGVVFSSESIGIFVNADDRVASDEELLLLLGFLASATAQELVWVFGRYRKIENRAVSGLPISFSRLSQARESLIGSARRGVELCAELASLDEVSPNFVLPDAIRDRGLSGNRRMEVAAELAKVHENIDETAAVLLGLGAEDVSASPRSDLVALYALRRVGATEPERAADAVMWAVGVAFGRWLLDPNVDLETFNASAVFSAPPRTAPATSTSPALRTVLVDDEGSGSDIAALVNAVLNESGALSIQETEDALSVKDLRTWLRKEFFGYHLRRYSGFKRRAPVYWQLATPSAEFSIWLNAQAVTPDTLYQIQNEHVATKLTHESQRLEAIRAEGGQSPKANERKRLETQERIVAELREFIAEVKLVAPVWHPFVDDGALINCSLLWRLVPHDKAWQKELRTTWAALVAGEYDWSHQAMRLWPERVVRKCAKDRSLAISHGLESVFWTKEHTGEWSRLPVPTRPIEELIGERSSEAVQVALENLLAAPDLEVRGRKATRAATGQGDS